MKNLSKNKTTIQTYIEGFSKSDNKLILSLLTDDVIWDFPGAFHHVGKEAFDKEIENDAFIGSPILKITRMVEENNIVVAEGTVQGKRKDETTFNALFCDVFEMHEGKIRKLTTYMAFLN